MQPAPHYLRHIFFCERRRDSGDACAAVGGPQGFDHCKRRVQEIGLAGSGRIRVNRSGCLNRCAEGPVAVVYPEGTWYTFVDEQDIDDIVDSHLQRGQPVERLVLPPPADLQADRGGFQSIDGDLPLPAVRGTCT